MRVIDDPNGWNAGRNKGLANSCDTLIRAGKLHASCVCGIVEPVV